ncbi:MAG: PEP-CTERM sorting domain-containing protein [Acidobacteriota bacterium]|jgi:hypothetical protein
MIKLVLFLASFLCVFVAPGFGAMVTFNTNSSTLCVGSVACSSQVQTVGGVTLTFVPNTGVTLNANPIASTSFGEIWLQCNDGSTTCAPENLGAQNLVLSIVFTQTSPDSATGSIDSTSITGSIGGNSGFAQITWMTPSVMVGLSPITYTVVNSPLNLNSPATSILQGANSLGPPGKTTIQGTVNDVPEPSTYALIGGALLGLRILRRRS